MSIRERYPIPQLPQSHYFVSIARGRTMRTFTARPWTVWAAGAAFAAMFAWGAGATAYIVFRDDMLSAYLARQSDMQSAYEDRLADARTALDKVASRQLLDQNSFEGKLHELLSRQALLEQHGDMVARIAEQASAHGGGGAPELHPRAKTAALSAFSGLKDVAAAPSSAKAYAPMDSTLAITPGPNDKPRPLDEPQRHSSLDPANAPEAADFLASLHDTSMSPTGRLGLIAISLDRSERKQELALQALDEAAKKFNERWKAIIAKAQLPLEEPTGSIPKGVGGPFIPVGKGDADPVFDKNLSRASFDVAQMERLKKALPYMPIREPLFGDMRETSPFGYRIDPFLGRQSLHPGIDLVQAYGAEIHATAAGKVVHAGPLGGYGNCVEIDHGGGIATRYGHMSQILVAEGDSVKAGDTIGLIGSTGRSTGPHLHYEVRIDGAPVDPAPALDVAAALKPWS